MAQVHQYDAQDLKDMDTLVKNSVQEVIDAYNDLKRLGGETGVGGTAGEMIQSNLAEVGDVIDRLQRSVQDMDQGVEAKTASQNRTNQEVESINRAL